MRLLTPFMLIFTTYALPQRPLDWGMEYRQKVGFLAAHHEIMSHLPQSHAMAGELSWYVHTKGRREWHEISGYPTYGITGFFGSVGNNKILGRFTALYGFMEFPFAQFKKARFLGKMGSGLGYTPKIFEQSNNPKNDAISTHLNALICFGLKGELCFGRNKVTLGLDMTHFSNGAVKMPNLGVNLPYLSLGYARQFNEVKRDSMKFRQTVSFKKWLFGVTAIGSVKEMYPTNRKKYPVYAVSAFSRRFYRPAVGLEVAFDVISKQAILDYKSEIPKSQWDILQMGMCVSYLLPLDRLHFAVGMGWYVKDKFQPEDKVYHRVGMRYYFSNGLHAQALVKSHWARADYVEWGVGYTFNFKTAK